MSNKAQTPADIRGWNINKSSCLGLSVHVIFCLFPCVGHTWGLSPLSSTLLHKTCGDIAAAKPLPHLFHWLEVDLKHFLNWLEAGEVQTEAPMYRASHVECGFPRKPGPIHDWATWGRDAAHVTFLHLGHLLHPFLPLRQLLLQQSSSFPVQQQPKCSSDGWD